MPETPQQTLIGLEFSPLGWRGPNQSPEQGAPPSFAMSPEFSLFFHPASELSCLRPSCAKSSYQSPRPDSPQTRTLHLPGRANGKVMLDTLDAAIQDTAEQASQPPCWMPPWDAQPPCRVPPWDAGFHRGRSGQRKRCDGPGQTGPADHHPSSCSERGFRDCCSGMSWAPRSWLPLHSKVELLQSPPWGMLPLEGVGQSHHG